MVSIDSSSSKTGWAYFEDAMNGIATAERQSEIEKIITDAKDCVGEPCQKISKGMNDVFV